MNTLTDQTKRGIQQSRETSGEDWHLYALKFVRRHLRKHRTLFVDELWDAGLTKPISKRAIGSVIKAAVKNEWMEKIYLGEGGAYAAQDSESSHGSPKPVWWSNLYRG